MAKFRRVKYQRRGVRKSRGRMSRRRPISRKSGGLAQRISRLERSIRPLMPTLQMNQYLSAACNSDFVAFNMTNYVSMVATFGTQAAMFDKETARHKSVGMDITVKMNNEYDNTRFTMFLISLKDNMSANWNPASGVLGLVANQHYTILNGMVMMNKEMINIHKIKRFSTGTNGINPAFGAQVGNQGGQEQGLRREHRFYIKQKIDKIVKNPGGYWHTLGTNPDPSRNYYLLFFNDNSSLDGTSPSLEINAIHQIQTI